MGCATTHQSEKLTSSKVQNLVNDQRFIFTAESMTPLRGRMQILTTPYDVIVKKDTLICYLPYFGRAYQVPSNPNNVGVQFTSNKYDYTFSPAKKNSWEIKLVPKDMTDIREMTLDIYNDGSAYLNILSNFRDAISYKGYISAIK